MEPASTDLEDLLEASFVPPTFSDDIVALQELNAEQKRQNFVDGVVVQHRSWSTKEVFHSDAQTLPTSPTMAPHPFLTSSPPPTPSPPLKRSISHVDLGENHLTRPSKAQRIYYGINIHQLLDDAQADDDIPKVARELPTPPTEPASARSTLLWTEKYRARKFTDLIGDERTHRSVMHWLKRWDSVVFPGAQRRKLKPTNFKDSPEEKPHRKILVLTGPPGLGKTTLAHVCAKQAGYEVQEINASDERSSSVVKGRIRDMLGTENVKGTHTKTAEGKVRKAGKPVCVIVDEVDGVVTGSGGGGEGGFIKALLDLVALDQKNSTPLGATQQLRANKRKGDRFRLLRPMILICNDIYHPSLRPLRQGPHAEVIHVGKAPVQSVISRLKAIFDKEGVPCEDDGVRRLCEATWGLSNRKEDRNGRGAGEGDMRGVIVVGEWVASKVRSMNRANATTTLTRRWVEDNILSDLAHGGGAARGLGRGNSKDIVARIFQEGAGFPKYAAPNATPHHQTGNTGPKGVAEGSKRTATEHLRELLATHGDTDRIMTDCFSQYPTHPFQGDTLLSKPDAAYEWLHFHDCLSSAVYHNNEWELAPYLSTPILGFHHLFASPTRAQYAAATLNEDAETQSETTHPFSGIQASWAAHEAEKQNTALLQSLQATLSTELSRSFNSPADMATDLVPYLVRMLSPNVSPVVIGGSGSDKSTASVRKASEQTLVQRAVQAMGASGVRFERTKVSSGDEASGPAAYGSQWIYRMEPPLDGLGLFETGGKAFGEAGAKTRFAVRQVLDQEWRKEEKNRAEAARLARVGGAPILKDAESKSCGAGLTESGAVKEMLGVKRDFFGRPITQSRPGSGDGTHVTTDEGKKDGERRVWITYHEGFSNAVRKPITLAELMKDL